jgi:cytochrome c oxidase subunit III
MSEVSLANEPLVREQPLPLPPPVLPQRGLGAAQWGMLSFLASETSLFCTLIVVYLAFLRADQSGPTPAVLSLSLVIGTTICLLTSSVTVHLAVKSLELGQSSSFVRWWSATIVLGIAFLMGTAYEWRELIVAHDLTISRNVFGTTYYTLVGFHALHVTVGVLAMLTVLGLTVARLLTTKSRAGAELVSWYWHFVDGVWVVVFSVVYLAGR